VGALVPLLSAAGVLLVLAVLGALWLWRKRFQPVVTVHKGEKVQRDPAPKPTAAIEVTSATTDANANDREKVVKDTTEATDAHDESEGDGKV
jgi:hypothetical protein